MKRKETYEEKKGKFLDMLLSTDKDQLSDFIKNKGRSIFLYFVDSKDLSLEDGVGGCRHCTHILDRRSQLVRIHQELDHPGILTLFPMTDEHVMLIGVNIGFLITSGCSVVSVGGVNQIALATLPLLFVEGT